VAAFRFGFVNVLHVACCAGAGVVRKHVMVTEAREVEVVDYGDGAPL
jgi:hypothetical protein